MNKVMLKIMLEGGHFLIVSRTEQAAKEMITAWEVFMRNLAHESPCDLLQGNEFINGKLWYWSVKSSSVLGMHTFHADPMGTQLGGAPWGKSG